MAGRSLQEWYIRINRIYLDRNFYRSTESIFCHLVEVGRGLAIAGSKIRKRDLNAEDFLPKTLAWWLALCGRVGIPDVERMVWTKYPYMCPYCRLLPHDGDQCKDKRSDRQTIDWPKLELAALQGEKDIPKSLSGWQEMFRRIYRRDEFTTNERNATRLSEEFGELAEAIRALPVAPEYFVSEAPDVLAWLMGFANQFDYERKDQGKTLEQTMEDRYPGACANCGYAVCKCPAILPKTLGRIAREGPIKHVFPDRPGLFSLSEAMNLFSSLEQPLVINGKNVAVTPAALAELAKGVSGILDDLKTQRSGQVELSAQVSASLGRLEALADQGKITQDSVQALLKSLSDLPSENRNAVVSFLTSASASALLKLILTGAALFK